MVKLLSDAVSDRLAPVGDWYRSYPRIHRVLIASSAVTAVAVLAMVVVFGVWWMGGGFSPSLTSEAEREIVVAESAYEEATEAARAAGVEPENYPPAVSAEANVVIALVDAGRIAPALDAAELLSAHAADNPRALYAVAYAYERSSIDGYTSQVLDFYAEATAALTADNDELARAVFLGYGRALDGAGKLEEAQSYLSRAAAVAPAAAEIYLEVAEVAERRSDWFGAALAYASAQAFDPLMVAAEEGFDRIAEAHPQEARAALESPSLPEGGADGHP